MKIGLDIHGVIDTNPGFFSELTRAIKNDDDYPFKMDGALCHEVHILTGSRLGNGKIEKWLNENGIFYTHLFSIADYLKANGKKELPESTLDNPWFCKEDWDIAKAVYAKKYKLDLVLDDRDAYFKHFTTPIARYYSKDKQ